MKSTEKYPRTKLLMAHLAFQMCITSCDLYVINTAKVWAVVITLVHITS